jgi:hypothetical protein
MPDGEGRTPEQERGEQVFQAWLRTQYTPEEVERINSDPSLSWQLRAALAQLINSGVVDAQALLEQSGGQPAPQAVPQTNPLNDWFLKEAWTKYLPEEVKSGRLTQREAEDLYARTVAELYPPIPQTPEEMEAYYREKTGKLVPLTSSGEKDWIAVQALIAADKNLQPKSIYETGLYKDYDTWRNKAISTYEKEVAKYQERLADEAARRQWEQAQFQTHLATTTAQQEELNKQYEARKQAILGAQMAQAQAAEQENIARRYADIDQWIKDNLLPLPSADVAYQEAIGGLVSPAMQSFFRGKKGRVYQEFVEGAREDPLITWWRELNRPIFERAEEMRKAVGVGVPITTAPLEALGVSREAALGTIGRFIQQPTSEEFRGLPLESLNALRAATGQSQLSERGTAGEGISYWMEPEPYEPPPNPWETYLGKRDWFKEFYSTPRQFRPGGYTQRKLAPMLRRF